VKTAALSITVTVLGLVLTGCGGGGGTGSNALSVLPAPVQTQSPLIAQGGPVTYLQSNGPLSSSGAIAQGAHQAIVAVMSGSTQASNTFASDTLLVGTPNTTSQSAVRISSATSRILAPKHIAPVEAFPADDGALVQRLQRFSVAAAPAATRTRQSVLPSTLRVGAQAPIWVQQGPMSGSRPSVQVQATLLAQTTHGNIWVDNSIVSTLKPNISQVEADFENAYTSDVAHFASPDYPSNAPGLQPQYSACSSSGAKQGTTPAYIQEPADRRIDVMVVNGPALGGLGGYFSVANLMPQPALNCLNGGYESNEAPFIFVGWFGGNGATYELQEDLVRSTAHELQHLINFVNHGILAGGASSASFNGYESTFVNEGLSMLAQDFAVQSMYGPQGLQFDSADALQRASAYLANPGNFSLTNFIGIDSANWGGNGTPVYNCNGGCYGGAYLFQRYLRDRFGGDAYTHAIETSGVVGTANLQAITGESAGQLQDDFALAMAANTMGVSSSDRRFEFGSLSLTQTYHDQLGGNTVLSGVFATPATGTSTSIHAPVGGFAYVAIPSVPSSGLTVQVTDQASVGGFSLAGGLAQH
jgi:hypothetical protein